MENIQIEEAIIMNIMQTWVYMTIGITLFAPFLGTIASVRLYRGCNQAAAGIYRAAASETLSRGSYQSEVYMVPLLPVEPLILKLTLTQLSRDYI